MNGNISQAATTLLILLAAAWFAQLTLSFLQTKRFYHRFSQLRRHGKRSAIGIAGSNWRTKTYGVLVVDEKDTIVCAEKLSGWTVFANLKPVNALVGLPLEALAAEPAQDIPQKTWLAFQNAAGYLTAKKSQVPTLEQGVLQGADA